MIWLLQLQKMQRKKGFEVRIVSHDKDLYQLIDDANSVYLFDPTKNRLLMKQNV